MGLLYLRHRAYINLRLLLRVIGYLLVIEAVFMLIPLGFAIAYEDESFVPFLICLGITGVSGSLMMMLKPKSREMGKRDAIVLTGFTWVILSLFGMLPFIFYGTHMSVTDAFFETMSGFTTTGTSVLSTLENVPRSILVWRCVTQWIGGLGIILFTIAVVPMLNTSGGMQMFNAEVTGITHDKLRPQVSYTAKGLWGVYAVLTMLLVILLSFSKMNFFEAFCYGLSSMSTGGFATSDTGMHGFESEYVKIVLTIFMFIGGVNFSLIYNSITGKFKDIFRNTALKVYLWMVLICTLLFSADVIIGGKDLSISDYTIDPLFQCVSVLSSTGIMENDFHIWGSISEVLLFLMVFIGACAGSTSGGAKIDRFVILFKFIRNEFYKMMHPGAVTTVSINGKGTQTSMVNKAIAFLFLYIIVIIVGGVALSLMGVGLSEGFFCSLMSISNSGLEAGATGLDIDYSAIPAAGKWLLSVIMLVGRLEIFTILLIFTPTFWKK